MIEVELPDGTVLEVDAATPEAAAQAARSYMQRQNRPQPDPGATPAPPIAGAGQNGGNLNWNEPGYVAENTPPPASPEPAGGPMRALQVGAQGVGRGLASLVGLPVDLASMAMDAGGWVLEKGAGALGYDIETPDFSANALGGSESIRRGAGELAAQAGMPPIPYDDMSGSERLAYNVSRLGSEATAGGAGLARTAATRFARPGTSPGIGDALLRPYANEPAAALRTDAAAGAGSGAAVTGVDQMVPEDSPMRPLADTVAVIAGGATGAVLPNVAQRAAQRALTPNLSSVPMGADNAPVPTAVADQAAEMVQRGRTEGQNQMLAGDIARQAEQFRAEGLPTPTVGAMAGGDAPNIAVVENQMRSRNPAPFIDRDRQVRAAASERVDSMAPEGADPQAARDTAGARLAQDRARAEAPVARAQDQMGRAESAATVADENRLAFGREQVPPGGVTAAQQRASTSFTDNVMGQQGDAPADTGGLRAMTGRKNELFDATDAQADLTPLAETVQRVEDGMRQLAPAGAQAPVDAMARVKTLAEGGSDTVSWQELSKLRRDLSAAQTKARGAGAFELSDNIQDLKSGIDRIADDLAQQPGGESIAQAQQYYRDVYAPVWAEQTSVNRQLRDAAFSGQPVDPAKVLDLYDLTAKPTPRAVEDLGRIVQVAKDPREAQSAVRRYVTADMAGSVIDADGAVNIPRLRAWIDHRSALLNDPRFAEIGREVQSVLQQAVNNERTAAGLKREVEQAAQALRQAEGTRDTTLARIDKSALRILLDNDPQQAARRVLASNDRAAAAREITERLGGDEAALAGWKKIMADEVRRRVQTTRMTDTDTREIGLAQLIRQVDEMRPVLTEVFSPEEMNRLMQARRLLEPYQNLSARATAGSNTYDKAMQDVWGTVSLVNRVLFGVLKGGGVTRTMKDAYGRFGASDQKAVEDLLTRMMTDPAVAGHLLTRNVRDVGSDDWNRTLLRLLALQEGGTDTDIQEPEQ